MKPEVDGAKLWVCLSFWQRGIPEVLGFGILQVLDIGFFVTNSPKVLRYRCWILLKCTTFGESDSLDGIFDNAPTL